MTHRVTVEAADEGNLVAWCTCGLVWTDETMLMNLVYQHLHSSRQLIVDYRDGETVTVRKGTRQ